MESRKKTRKSCKWCTKLVSRERFDECVQCHRFPKQFCHVCHTEFGIQRDGEQKRTVCDKIECKEKVEFCKMCKTHVKKFEIHHDGVCTECHEKVKEIRSVLTGAESILGEESVRKMQEFLATLPEPSPKKDSKYYRELQVQIGYDIYTCCVTNMWDARLWKVPSGWILCGSRIWDHVKMPQLPPDVDPSSLKVWCLGHWIGAGTS